jgi:CRISPR-associated protein Cas5t
VTLWLRVRAPFAAFRWMQAGVYRATSPVIPPTAAWGLVLNLAGVETRDPTPSQTTLIRADAPPLRLAIGVVGEDPEVGVLYQQLHSYPVGNSGKELAERTHGAKYWIAPVKREILVNFDCLIGVEADDPALLERVRRGIAGELDEPRYGLPFAGDNNFIIDQIEVLEAPIDARWYVVMDADSPPQRGSCRLTVGIDRADAGRTTALLFAPTPEPQATPPAAAWVRTPYLAA